LQQLPNSDLRKLPSEKGKGLAGTIIIHFVLLLVLVFVSFSMPPPPVYEEGIMVNFGTDETGLGELEPSPVAAQAEAVPPPPSNNAVQAEEEPLLTQNDEEAPEVKKIDPEAEKKKKELAEAERIKRETLEAERKIKEQEEIERKRIEAEQQRQADIMNRTKNALAGSKNAGSNSTSEGIAGGPGNQGVPTGSVDSKVRGDGGGTGNSGISYDLGGRGYQKLPEPEYKYQGEGRVVVEVYVDRQGKVNRAITGVKGSTTLDEYLLRVAKDAAMQARFNADPSASEFQKGTITYNFKLK
jgi:TonB family protein